VNAERAKELSRRDSGVVLRVLVVFAPTAILAGLAIVQLDESLRSGVVLLSTPSWPLVFEVTRRFLYGSFILGAAIILRVRGEPRSRDGRASAVITSLAASFLLTFDGLLPAGPVVWGSSLRIFEVGLLVSAIGAFLAVATLASLRLNFSIIPEAQSIVTTGTYRWLRHPMYLAELLMIAGFALSGLRIRDLVVVGCVLGLQINRIHLEERILLKAFPNEYRAFILRTHYRLIPLIW
jgi:protein-S-isoprenylcysteine O-methyltransferase Ste14